MKFKLIPNEIIGLELFQNKKDKTKKVWIRVTWGFIRWHEFHTNDLAISENCTTVEQIQKNLDVAIKKAVSVSMIKKNDVYLNDNFLDNLEGYGDLEDLYNIEELSRVLSTDKYIFENNDSGGGLSASVFQWDNISEEEKQKTATSVRDGEEVTLKFAAENFQDDVLIENFNYEQGHYKLFYRLPLKVVAELVIEKNMTKEEALKIVKKDGFKFENLQFADDSLKKDKEFVLEAVKLSGFKSALQYADNSLKKDREIVLEAVKQSMGFALQFADDSLRKDKKIVLEAVKQNGTALQFADDSLKKDKKIVLEAVKQDGRALQYADDSLKNVL